MTLLTYYHNAFTVTYVVIYICCRLARRGCKMFGFLAELVDRGRWTIVLGAVVFAVVAGYFGGPVAGLMTNDDADFEDPASESVDAREQLEEASGVSTGADLVALVKTGGDIESSGVREKVTGVADGIQADPAAEEVLSYYETRDPDWVSEDGNSTYVIASFKADADAGAAAERLREEFADNGSVTLGGGAVVGPQVGETVGRDLARAELLAFPILLLLSFWIFRGFVAALLPLAVGVISIVGTFLGLWVVNEQIAPLSVFALNLVTGLGLGLAIDYSLFIVSRYREELERVGPGREALRRTLSTAGRTVAFSALTVSAALAGLLVFPQRFLYSMGAGGMLVALFAAAVALVVLPAVLALLGERVNALSPRRWRRSAEQEARSVESGGWYRLASGVMRRPVAVAVAATVLLITVGIPFLDVKFTSVDASVLPGSASARQVSDALEKDFPNTPPSPIYLAAEASENNEAADNLKSYAADLRDLSGVESVAAPRFLGDDTWRIDVVPSAEDAFSERSQELVAKVRTLETPYPVGVGGETASFVDQQSSLLENLPVAMGIVFAATLVLLFLMTGSVLLPVKALVMNLLTISATFGVLVWIFQYGRLEGLLGYTSQGALDSTQPILVMIVAFALSTDYGVFLLSRIKEARDSGLENTEAVAVGVGRTGRIITAAALLFCIAIGAFATSQIVFIKQVGVGTAFAVIIDATVVRAFLVPSLMRLLGDWNWWSPRPLRRLQQRIGLEETTSAEHRITPARPTKEMQPQDVNHT